MNTPDIKSKNKQYTVNYRNKQKAMGRRARLLFLSDEEFESVKETIRSIRIPKEDQ